ncbi:reactivating factor for ethanolamine ammonia lyase [compost metagenome]
MLFVCESDMAKSLAYLLLGRLPESRRNRLICLDQLLPGDGDYLDVGEPIKEDVVPVVIKSLVFGG